MAKIKITSQQLGSIEDYVGDIEFVELEEGNGGNIVVYPDGNDEQKFTLDEKGEEL